MSRASLQLTAALSDVSLAESALETALRELKAGPRAEKVTVTEVVAHALSRLRIAREELDRLRELIGDE